jgi:hypothetical protein
MFQLLWHQYRTWGDTSAHLKQRNGRWRKYVLILTLVGTACATLGGFAPTWLARLPIVGAAALAMATYLGKQLLDTAHEERWTRARAAAEAFKSEACKYLVHAAPYDGPDRASHLKARITEIAKVTKDQTPDDITGDALNREMPTAAWSIDDYLKNRLDDQIVWYRKRAAEHTASMRKGRALAVILGIAATVLSALTGVTAGGQTFWAAVLGIVTTAGGSIGAYFQSGHFEAVALKYRETALALEGLKADFKTAPTQQNAGDLVTNAEAIMQAENAAWLTELTAKA